MILYAGDRRGTIISAKAAATINHHYYPEGDWGWVVVGCATFVHAITFGSQFAFVSSDIIQQFPGAALKSRQKELMDDNTVNFIKGK